MQQVTDTLTSSYNSKWQGAGSVQQSDFLSFLTTGDLIFIVLGVTLIIWTVLIIYILRLEKKLQNLEQSHE